MRLNLSKFRKIHDDDQKAILEHPDGHQFTIAKSSLSPENQDEIKKMELYQNDPDDMVEGDDSAPQLDQTPPPAPAPQNSDANPNLFVPNSPQIQSGDPGTVPNSPLLKEGDPGYQPPKTSSDQINADPMANYHQMMKAQSSAPYALAKAQGDLGKAQANALEQQKSRLQAAEELGQNESDSLQKNIQTTQKEIKDFNYDSGHLYSTLSTPNKISNILALALGGFGAGFHGGPNYALQVWNKQVDDDLRAQEQQLGKKKTLLSAYQDQYKDLKTAQLAARQHIMEDTQTELQRQAALAQDPIAKANAQAMSSQIGLQQAQLDRQFQLQRMLDMGKIPTEYQGMLDPKTQALTVKLPDGTLGKAATEKDAETARETFSGMQNVLNLLDTTEQTMNEHGRAFVPSALGGSYATQTQSLHDSISLELNKALHNLARLNPTEFAVYEKQVPNAGDFQEGKTGAKIQALRQFIHQKMASEMNNYLTGPNRFPNNPNTMSAPNLVPKVR